MRSASTEVGGTVDKVECSSSTFLLQRSELGVGAALCSHVELIRGKVLVCWVVDSEFSLHDD